MIESMGLRPALWLLPFLLAPLPTCGGETPVPASAAIRTPRVAPTADPPAVAIADAGPPLDPGVTALAVSLDVVVKAAIAEGKLPGCVVAIGRHDGVVLRRAYGDRAVEPERVPMTLDTVFDLASLTKPIATATSVMVLVDRGQVALDDPASRYVPELAVPGKQSITLRHLLTHTSGLVADTPISDYEHERDEVIRRIAASKLRAAPGQQFIYSDAGFLLLEEVVRRVTQRGLDEFAREAIFAPLGMTETGFLPREELRRRAAPTEQRDGAWIQGEVHDPRAHLLGGVAGHAGLFSTADDVALYARAMLQRGELGDHRILSPRVAQVFTARHDVPGAIRALGWDVKSPFSTNRGDGLSLRAFGHGGFTGTSLWIDPESDLFVVFLSNRVHPAGRGAVNPLAGRIGTLAAASLGPRRRDIESPRTLETGVDVLRAEAFERLRGAHVGLVTNVSGKAKDGASTIDLLQSARDVSLVALFAPEHGLDADREGRIVSGRDERTGLPVVSLFGDTFSPPADALVGIDTLVFDIQDVGTRFYTYSSTMRRAMATAAERQLRFVVLDRPNPIDGVDVSGPILVPTGRSFVNHHPLPVRHGMTIGELAELFDADDHMGLDLQVVRLRGWRREDYFDATGLHWVNPSPNLRSTDEALLYPAIGLLEGTNLSVGRGTDVPFEVFGAPWIDGPTLASALNAAGLAGVTFDPFTFTPRAWVYRGEPCGGVRVRVTSRGAFEPVRTGLAIALELRARYPAWKIDDLNKLLASSRLTDAVRAMRPLAEIEAMWAEELAAFRAKRDKYLLYP